MSRKLYGNVSRGLKIFRNFDTFYYNAKSELFLPETLDKNHPTVSYHYFCAHFYTYDMSHVPYKTFNSTHRFCLSSPLQIHR